MKDKKQAQKEKARRQCGPGRCLCAEDPYKNRRLAFSSFWDDGADHEHTDDDIYGLICRMEQRHREYQPIEPDAAQKVVQRARKETEKVQESSRVMLGQSLPVAPFSLDEIKLGHLLGSGGFSSVYEINSFQPSPEREYSPEEEEARQFLTTHAVRSNKGEKRYAIKYLRRRLLDKPRKYANGAIDLVMEALFLEKLEHPHILKIRGVSVDGLDGFASGRHDAYFIIIDKMKETLEDRVFQWRKKLKRLKKPIIGKMLDRNGKCRKQLLAERLLTAYQIASAMNYLHCRNIIYRDLKPNNIGFDIRGDTKIFDFGLCREMPEDSEAIDGRFKMSGKVGTVRYMAPEVKNRERYNKKADVYSYALVLYEILALSRPKEKTKSQKEAEAATTHSSTDEANDTERFICPCWPVPVQSMIRRAWSVDIDQRPTMKEICDILREEIIKLRDGDTTGLSLGVRRRSTHVLKLEMKNSGRSGGRTSSVQTSVTESVAEVGEGSGPL